MSPPRKAGKKTLTPDEVERAAVRELVKAARARGEELTGPDGLLKAITKQVLEAGLEEEMTEHVGYDKHAAYGRNGARAKTGADRQRRSRSRSRGTGTAASSRSSSRSASGG